MNKDQVVGKTKEIAGDVQEKFGKAIGSKSQEAKGQAREVEGKIQKKAGDVKEAIKERTNH